MSGRILGCLAAVLMVAAALLAGPCARAGGAETSRLLDYIQGSELQIETDDQRCELALALSEIAAGPPERVLALRFADYAGEPGRWTAVEVLERYLLAPGGLDAEDAPALLAEAAAPAVRDALLALRSRVIAGVACEAGG